MMQSSLSNVRRSALIASLLLLQHTFTQALPVIQEEIITTAYGISESTANLPLSAAVVGQHAIELTGHQHIQEIINQLPGVNFHRNDGQESLPAIRSAVLSGPGACGSVLTLEDGIPLRPVGFCNVNELFESHSEQAERIEVLRGPGTVLYGSGAMHGVLNVISPARLDTPLTIGAEINSESLRRLRLRGGDETLGYALSVANDVGYRKYSGYDQQKLSLIQAHRFEDLKAVSRLTAVNLNQETAGYIEGPHAYRNRALGRSNPNPEAYRDGKALRLATTVSPRNEESWQISPYARWSEMDFLQHFLPGQPIEENGQRSVGLKYRYQGQANEQIAMIAGADVELGRFWLKQTQLSATEGSAFLQETIPIGNHYDYNVTSSVAALYGQGQWQASEKLNFVAGARAEWVHFDYDNLMLSGRTRDDGTSCGFGGCRYNRPSDREDHFSHISPALSLSYRLDNDQLLYLAHSWGYRAPEVSELYRLQREQSVTDLKPENIRSTELGLKYSDEILAYSIALFTMRKENVILRDVNFFNVSAGKTSHEGIEASVNYRFNPRWQLDLNSSFARHQYENNPGLSMLNVSGNDEDSAPRHFGNLTLNYTPSEFVDLQLQWQHMGKYYTDPENLHQYPGHELFHMRMFYKPSPMLRYSLQLSNLLDRKYAERADFTAFGGDRYFPGRPREITFGVEYRFAD